MESGINRRINREKLDYDTLVSELGSSYERREVFSGYKKLLETRKEEKAFMPNASQKVLRLGEQVFALLRGDEVACVVNTSAENIDISVPFAGRNIISGMEVNDKITLKSFEYMWIKK